ncbi:MAG: class I SAM-dependent methyltransferase [Dysgonamonadaceae bacterium]|jgi:hypothetical protein|nr:class I SAM-dependent methyltransferase [Dysgonamonadaceae bacterium]
MSNLFDKLFEISDTVDSLDEFLNENMQAINEFYNSDYKSICLSKDSVDAFIQFKHKTIAELNYEKTYTKSFVLMLLEYCERFNFIGAIPHIYAILNKNDIQINSRIQAALLFMYNVDSNSTFVDRFEEICKNLEKAIEFEEDNDKKSIATFLNYYSCVVRDTYPHTQFATELKSKIYNSINNDTYQFLKHESIAQSLEINVDNVDDIQKIIDALLEKTVCIPANEIEDEDTCQNFIIETDTDYSRELLSVPNNFDSIRSISVSCAETQKISGRGVKIPESENELFGYLKSFGNMHKAKLQSAFEALPVFPSNVSVIDWGCGQGIASMIFFEKYGNATITHITLIEPSKIAIKRAALHCKKYCPDIPLKTICKKLDNLKESDFNLPQSDITIHLFSNILDIDDYSQRRLIKLIEQTQTGQNYVVCASPYIDTIKTGKLESFRRHFESYDSFEPLLDITNTKRSDDDFWCCNNSYKGCPCLEHPGNGCNNKWTRVIKVFGICIQTPSRHITTQSLPARGK